MIDLDETCEEIERLFAYLARHKDTIQDPVKQRDFFNDIIERFLIISARLFAHIEKLDKNGRTISTDTLILPQRVRKNNELHINGTRKV